MMRCERQRTRRDGTGRLGQQRRGVVAPGHSGILVPGGHGKGRGRSASRRGGPEVRVGAETVCAAHAAARQSLNDVSRDVVGAGLVARWVSEPAFLYNMWKGGSWGWVKRRRGAIRTTGARPAAAHPPLPERSSQAMSTYLPLKHRGLHACAPCRPPRRVCRTYPPPASSCVFSSCPRVSILPAPSFRCFCAAKPCLFRCACQRFQGPTLRCGRPERGQRGAQDLLRRAKMGANVAGVG
ncbi:hypothetical protein BV20DRAFT_679816 [Pilatotrama ljubarskyi]|nr:hypothetical protein BV20DRAFT_679816 [Pilatotrama ljubarskyi]